MGVVSFFKIIHTLYINLRNYMIFLSYIVLTNS